MSNNDKTIDENELRGELVEALLDYLEGRRTFRSVLILGINAHNFYQPFQNEHVAKTVSELNSFGSQVADGKNFSKEEIKETFTTLLEHLVSKDKIGI